jgi:Zn-dependent protease with chaperone function
MLPVLGAMDHPLKQDGVQVSIADDPSINAGSAGGGVFVVTTGLLQKANDEELQAVMAHEAAHDDLGHVAKTQRVGVGLNIATVVLDQLFPGSGQIAPIAGSLLIRAYGRKEEYAADRHGVEILNRLYPGKGKQMMVDTLTWLKESTGGGGGGFFATHPDTGDRIERVKEMP